MDTYDYKNSETSEPNGPFIRDELALLRKRGYLNSRSFIRMNDGVWKTASEFGIPFSYPKSCVWAACGFVILLWLAGSCFTNMTLPLDAQTVNGQPNIWTWGVDHQWWRLAASSFLAPGFGSLCSVSIILLVALPGCIPVLGIAGSLLLYLICGMGGSACMLEWYLLHRQHAADPESLYFYQSIAVPGILFAAYGMLGAALALGGRRPCGMNSLWAWVAVIMAATVFCCNLFMDPAFFGFIVLAFLAGIVLVSPILYFHRRRQKEAVSPSAPPRRLPVQACCLGILLAILGGTLFNYRTTGSESAIRYEELAHSAINGTGIPFDERQVVDNILKSAKMGYPYAWEAAAYCYMDGICVIRPEKMYRRKYRPGEYRNIKILPSQPELAAYWLERAARAGFRDAQAEWGLACLEGRGTRTNRTEARRWIAEASLRGSLLGHELLNRINREEQTPQVPSEANMEP